MNEDFFYKSLFFGVSYGLIFFLVYLVGRNSASSFALRSTVGSWVGLMMIMWLAGGIISGLLFIPTVIVLLFACRKKATNELKLFFEDNHIYKATIIPEQISALLGSHFYSCAEGTVTTQSGEAVVFNWWQGMTTSTVSTGTSRSTTYNHFLAVSFAPNTVSIEFKQLARDKADLSALTFRQKFKRFFVLDTERPCRIEETQDGSFIIMWQTYQVSQLYTSYLTWLKENLSTPKKEQGTANSLDDSTTDCFNNTSVSVKPVQASTAESRKQASQITMEPTKNAASDVPSSHDEQYNRVTNMIQCYVESVGLTRENTYNDQNKNWLWKKGSASIEVFIYTIMFPSGGRRDYLRICSPLMKIPANNLLNFYRHLLELNDIRLGVKLGIMPNTNTVFATYERDIRGMDFQELTTCISDLEGWADELDDQLKAKFPDWSN